jgi:hypothetical protein
VSSSTNVISCAGAEEQKKKATTGTRLTMVVAAFAPSLVPTIGRHYFNR